MSQQNILLLQVSRYLLLEIRQKVTRPPFRSLRRNQTPLPLKLQNLQTLARVLLHRHPPPFLPIRVSWVQMPFWISPLPNRLVLNHLYHSIPPSNHAFLHFLPSRSKRRHHLTGSCVHTSDRVHLRLLVQALLDRSPLLNQAAFSPHRVHLTCHRVYRP